ncbi:MAG: redoxin domain-containing protein [Elusimicrobia bacterium]|nr:redoxin domain-containing protein [Elusimicrobiota bacterium]
MAETTETLAFGAPAPEFEAVDEQGHRHRLSEYRGTTLVLCFLPPEDKDRGPDAMAAFPGNRRRDIFLLGVMKGAPQAVGKAKARRSLPFPVLADPAGRIAADYGVSFEKAAAPRYAFFVIDPEGRLKRAFKNFHNFRHLAELLRRA